MGDQWEQILIRQLPSHRFGDWVSEPRLPFGAAPQWGLWVPEATLLMGTMFRILDLPAACAQRRVASGAPIAFGLDVVDAQIAENRGSWRLELDGGRASVSREAGSQINLRLDVSTLSRLFIGALPATAAHASGLLECDRPELLPTLDAALALPEPWTFDRF
jgi:predicted acetyltransferase